MAENIIAETALEKDQKPSRYNQWMYQNYMIAEGIKALGDALGKQDFSAYKKSNSCIIVIHSTKLMIDAQKDIIYV